MSEHHLEFELEEKDVVADDNNTLIAYCGTLPYMAPEILLRHPDFKEEIDLYGNAERRVLIHADADEKKKSYDLTVDVFSFGVMAFEVLTLINPWVAYDKVQLHPRKHLAEFRKAILCGRRLEFPVNFENQSKQHFELVTLVEKLWHEDPKKRLGFTEIIAELQKIQRVLINHRREKERQQRA